MNLFFGTDRIENDKEIINNVIKEVLNTLGNNTKLLYYTTSVVDGDNYIDVLFTTHIDNINNKILEHIGDSCFSNRYSILDKYKLYGQCSPIHELFTTYYHYDEFREKIYKWCDEHGIK